jgi:hypothetical protein
MVAERVFPCAKQTLTARTNSKAVFRTAEAGRGHRHDTEPIVAFGVCRKAPDSTDPNRKEGTL